MLAFVKLDLFEQELVTTQLVTVLQPLSLIFLLCLMVLIRVLSFKQSSAL